MSDQPTKPYACSYWYRGEEWAVTIHAYDLADARDRANRLGMALQGEIMGQTRAGWLAKLWCWAMNQK